MENFNVFYCSEDLFIRFNINRRYQSLKMIPAKLLITQLKTTRTKPSVFYLQQFF